jgi:hypothetical protein
METLKSGDAPALLTNIEVMEILEKRLTLRESCDTNSNKKTKQNSQLRHCEFIEREVYNYLQNTPCAKLNIDDMPTLVSKLKQNHTVITTTTTTTTTSNPSMVHLEDTQHDDNDRKKTGYEMQTKLTKFGLTDAEIMQILNLMPTELVEAHLVVEELHTRLNDEQQEELLQLIRDYVGIDEEQDGKHDDDHDDDAPLEVMEEEVVEE